MRTRGSSRKAMASGGPAGAAAADAAAVAHGRCDDEGRGETRVLLGEKTNTAATRKTKAKAKTQSTRGKAANRRRSIMKEEEVEKEEPPSTSGKEAAALVEEGNVRPTSELDLVSAMEAATQALLRKTLDEDNVVLTSDNLFALLRAINGGDGGPSGEAQAATNSSTLELMHSYVLEVRKLEKRKTISKSICLSSWRAACEALDIFSARPSFFLHHPLHYLSERYHFLLSFHQSDMKVQSIEQAWKLLEVARRHRSDLREEESAKTRKTNTQKRFSSCARDKKEVQVEFSTVNASCVVCSLLHILSWIYSESEKGDIEIDFTSCITRVIPYCGDVVSGWMDHLVEAERVKYSSSIRTFCFKLVQSQIAAVPKPKTEGEEANRNENIEKLLTCALGASLGQKEQIEIPALLLCIRKKLGKEQILQLYEIALETYYNKTHGMGVIPASSVTYILAKCAMDYAKHCKQFGQEARATKAIERIADFSDRMDSSRDTVNRFLKLLLLSWRTWKAEARTFESIRDCEKQVKLLLKDAGKMDKAVSCCIWESTVHCLDALRNQITQRWSQTTSTSSSQVSFSLLVADNETDAIALVSLLECCAPAISSLHLSGPHMNTLKKSYALAATSLLTACKLRVSWFLENEPTGGTDTDIDFEAIKDFLLLSKRIGPEQIGEQALWFAKSVYNIAIEVLNKRASCRAQQLFEISFLSLSVLFEDDKGIGRGEEKVWMKVGEGKTPAGNSLPSMAMFGIKVSEGMLKCHQAESWARAIKSMSDVIVDYPELVSRVVKGAQESHYLLKAKGIQVNRILLQALLQGHGANLGFCFADEILLSGARLEDGILVEMMEVLQNHVQTYDKQKTSPVDLQYLRLLLQIVAVTKSLVLFGKHSQNPEYVRNCIHVALGIQRTFEESRLHFEGNLEHRKQIICRSFLAWTNCHLAAMAKHLDYLSPTLAEDVSHWSVFATESFVNWEEYLQGTSEYAEREPPSVLVREREAIRAIASLCNEGSYVGQTELLDRGNKLLVEWLSHQRCQERSESGEAVHLYLAKIAYHCLAKAYSNYTCPGEILDSIRDVSAMPKDDTNSDAIKGFIAIAEGSQDLMREEASAVNFKLRSVQNGRLLRGVLQIMISAMHHQNGEYGVALAHAVEASRLMQSVIKSCLDKSKERSSEKCTAEGAVVRNLHVFCLLYTGDLRCICGMPEEASRAYHEVLHQAGSHCNLFLVSIASLRMFKAYYMRCEWQKARKHLDNAKEILEKFQGEAGSHSFSSKMIEIETLLSHGSHSVSVNENGSALEHMQKALELSSTFMENYLETEYSDCFAERVIASQISQMEISAKLQMAEVHLLSEHREQASNILGSLSSSAQLQKHTDAGFKSKYLFISAILDISERYKCSSDIGTMRSLLKYGEDTHSAICHLDFEDRPEMDSDAKEDERILDTLLEAYRESRGIPVLSYKVAQLLSLLFSPADPFQASVFLHASIGISYHLQSTYIMRTAFLQDDFSKGRGSLSAKHKLAPDVFEGLLALDLADLREDATLRSKIFGVIPEGVAVCSVSVVRPADLLGISTAPVLTFTRTLRSQRSVSVKIPLRGDFLGTKSCEGNGSSTTFLNQLRSILSRSNASMKHDWDFSEKKQMKKWWTIRMKLDQELEILLKDVDRDILGPYSVFLLGEATSNRDLLVERVESICAATLKLKKEAMDQLTLVLLHARSFEEKDICVQIKTVLLSSGASYEMYDATEWNAMALAFKSAGEKLPPVKTFSPGSVLLVLDGQCQPFPWESLPCFKGQEFYRVPSLSYVHRAHQNALDRASAASCSEGSGSEVEWENAYFLLNPSGDLTSTQKCFEKWFTEEQGWPGTSGKAPGSAELLRILSMKDIFLYFGHGTCEQYISKTMIETLQTCSSVFLMGCSSARLSNNYMNQGRGFLLSYLLAGSPLAIGNLWDVTDKDIDRFAKSVLESCLIDDEEHETGSEVDLHGGERKENNKRRTLTASRIMQARQACRLTTLTGSAPVYYGLPW